MSNEPNSNAICRCGAPPHATDPERCARGHGIPGAALARKHAINENRRAVLLAKYIEEYVPGDSQRLTSACEQLASVTERLETVRMGSTESQRLVGLANSLGELLEASRVKRVQLAAFQQRTADRVYVEKMERLFADGKLRLVGDEPEPQAPEPISEFPRLTAPAPPPSPMPVNAPEPTAPAEGQQATAADIEPHEPTGAVQVAPEPAPTAEPEPTSQEASSVPQCPHCSKSLAACTTMRETRLDTWEALHSDHPDMIEKRRQYNTRVMMKMIGKPLPSWYR